MCPFNVIHDEIFQKVTRNTNKEGEACFVKKKRKTKCND